MNWMYYEGTYTIKILVSILISIIGGSLGVVFHKIVNKNKKPTEIIK